MPLTPSWPGVTGLATTTDARKNLAGLIVRDASGNPRAGVFRGAASIVTARGDMNVDIAAFVAAAVQFGGPILIANDGVAQLPSALVSPGAGTNYYVIYAKQNESTSPGTDANNNRLFGAQLSTTSFAVARAALPAGALELATVQVPTGVASTSAGGVTITQTHQFTCADGGILPLRNLADLDAITTMRTGQVADVFQDSTAGKNGLYRWSGAAWLPVTADKLVFARAAANVATNASVVAIASMAAVLDNGSFTHSAGVFTCVKAGVYNITLSLFWAANATGGRTARVTTSTGLNRAGKDSPTAGVEAGTVVSALGVTFAPGDTVTVWQQQNSGGNLSMAAEVMFERIG